MCYFAIWFKSDSIDFMVAKILYSSFGVTAIYSGFLYSQDADIQKLEYRQKQYDNLYQI